VIPRHIGGRRGEGLAEKAAIGLPLQTWEVSTETLRIPANILNVLTTSAAMQPIKKNSLAFNFFFEPHYYF
jgi:hypothetical protein